MDHKFYMKEALKRAKAAYKDGETPVGAVIVKDGKVIASGRNYREKRKNALCHAEIVAINRACKRLGSWRLADCDIYVTLEPCPMCAGAIINSRIRRVVYGASDGKAGSFGSLTDLSAIPYNHKPEIVGGVMEKECGGILTEFFKELRIIKKKNKQSEEENK